LKQSKLASVCRSVDGTAYVPQARAGDKETSVTENGFETVAPRTSDKVGDNLSETRLYARKVYRTNTDCAALPTANTGLYTTLYYKPLLFWFSCKWQHSL